MTGDRQPTIDNPKVPPGLHVDAEDKEHRDDEKGDRLAIEGGNRDRGPKPEGRDNRR